jgi:putative flippase GtrA
VIWNYLLQLIDLYRDLHPRRLRFLKTSIIGFGAIIINLLVFLMVVQALGWRDWRASALGTLIAVLSGVGLRKWWLSKRRARARVTVKSSARSLRLATTGLVTLVLNTTSFALLFWAVADPAPAGAVRTLTLVICQTISILLGVGINYILDEHVSWRHGAHSSSFAVKAPNQ